MQTTLTPWFDMVLLFMPCETHTSMICVSAKTENINHDERDDSVLVHWWHCFLIKYSIQCKVSSFFILHSSNSNGVWSWQIVFVFHLINDRDIDGSEWKWMRWLEFIVSDTYKRRSFVAANEEFNDSSIITRRVSQRQQFERCLYFDIGHNSHLLLQSLI